MVEPGSFHRLERMAAESRPAKDTFKNTQEILERILGISVTLSPSNVSFAQHIDILNEDIRQSIASNDLAKTIVERDLPLALASNRSNCDGIVTSGGKSPQLQVSFEIGRVFNRALTSEPTTRELVSRASMDLFRNLFNLSILSQSQDIYLTSNPEIVRQLRQDALDTIRKAAYGERSGDILDLASEVEEKTANLRQLSVIGKGADFDLCLNGSPIYRWLGKSADMLDLLEVAVESRYADIMHDRALWFTHPSRWKHAESKKYITDYNIAIERARITNPRFEIPDDPREVVKLFLSGEFAKRALIQATGVENLSDQYSQDQEPDTDNTQELLAQFGHLIPEDNTNVVTEDFNEEESGSIDEEEQGTFQRFTIRRLRRRAE